MKRNNKIATFIYNFNILMILPPFYTMIYYIVNLYKRKKSSIFYFSCSEASVLTLMIPMFDIVYTYDSYLFLKKVSMRDFISYKMPFYHWIFYILKNIMEFWYIYFLIIIFMLYLWNNLYFNNTKNISGIKQKYVFLIFISALWYRNILDITRYTLATIIYIYIVFKYLHYKKGKYLILVTILIHNSFYIFVILFYLSIFFKKIKINIKKFLFVGILMTIIIKILNKYVVLVIIFISQFISDRLYKRTISYITESNILTILNSPVETLKYCLIFGTSILFLIIIIIIILKRKKNQNFIDFLIIESYLVMILFFDRYILSERIFILIYLLTLQYLFFNYKVISINIFKMVFIVVLSNYLFFTACYINIFYIQQKVPHLKTVENSKFEIIKSIYQPTMLVIYNNKYTEKWLDEWRKK